MPINISSKKTFIRKIIIKESSSHFFFIGTYNIKKSISYLQIKRLKFDKYNYKQFYSYTLKNIIEEKDLEEIKDNNNNNFLKEYFEEKLEAKDYLIKAKEINCLFGFIKFNMGYYAIFSCDSEIVGKIQRNLIYRVDRLIYFPLFEVEEDFKQSNEYIIEKKYLTLVTSYEYDKQLYFSYSYDLTKTFQRNFVENFKREMIQNYEESVYTKDGQFENYSKRSKNKENSLSGFNVENNQQENTNKSKILMKKYTNYYFCWNYFHMKEFFNLIKNKAWINFCIYGYFHQVVCNIKGLSLVISIVARRNRNYAGMRYLKRGITDDGNVANDVETEQILEEISTTWLDRPKISSFIQIRGSIPIYWYQYQTNFYAKPPINLNLSDIEFKATKRHFASLLERYGYPCFACNLTKKIEDIGKEQETLLNEWYYKSVKYINNNIKNFEKIHYCHYDLKNERGQKNFYKKYYKICGEYIDKTNFFCFMPTIKNKYSLFLQNGVVRANCIDCLDRTNVFQQILGISVLVLQLQYIGIKEKFPENENENIYGVLTELYIKMGHELSNQYAGSLAIKQAITENKNIMDKLYDSFNEILIAIKRSVISYFIGQSNQNAMNLFLGKYPINAGLPYIWDMPNDEILHKKKNLKELDKNWYEKKYKNYIIFNLFSDIDKKRKIQKDGKIIFIEKSGETFSGKEVIGKTDKNDGIKMSTTSLLIFNEFGLKSNNINRENSNNNIKKNDNNIILPFNKVSMDNIPRNINQYVLDFNSYIEYKSKKKDKEEEEEEKAFEDDTINRYLPEVNKRDIRDFYDFEYFNINFIKKNILNINNNNVLEKGKGNQSYKNINTNNNNFYKIGKKYFSDFNNVKSQFRRKTLFNSNYSTPIKSKLPNPRYVNYINEPYRFQNLKSSHFIPYTPYAPQITSTIKMIPPNIQDNYCTNPRNVFELKKEMIKLDFCSFQFNESDFNKINDFTQTVDKELSSKEISELDPFNTCDLGTTEGIVETQKITEEIQEVDLYKNLFSFEEKNKVEPQNEVDDYIIFDFKTNQQFKKTPNTLKKKTNLMPTKDFFPNIQDTEKKEENKIEKNSEEIKLTFEEKSANKEDKKNVKSSEEDNNGKDDSLRGSTKIAIRRIKRNPLKIEDNFFTQKIN